MNRSGHETEWRREGSDEEMNQQRSRPDRNLAAGEFAQLGRFVGDAADARRADIEGEHRPRRRSRHRMGGHCTRQPPCPINVGKPAQ
jgi:hypothetical protein